jgi:cholesterol transport system auxiliary component
MTSRRCAVSFLGLAGTPWLLTACGGSLLPKAAPARLRYALDEGSSLPGAMAASARPAAPVLVVDAPRPQPGHDGTRMLYQRHPQELEAYAYAEWVAPPATLLAPLLVRALQRTGAFSAVLLAPAGAPGAWRLACEFVSLRQDFSATPSRVRLALRAVLQDSAERRVLAWRDFEQEEPSRTEDAAGGVAASSVAVRHLLENLASWCAAPALGELPARVGSGAVPSSTIG